MADADYSESEQDNRQRQRPVTPPPRERLRSAVNHTPQSSAPSSPQARQTQTRSTRSSRRLSNSITTNILDSPSALTRQQQLRQEQERAFQEDQRQDGEDEDSTVWESIQDAPSKPVNSPRPGVRKRRLRSTTRKSKITNTPSRTTGRRRNYTPDTGTPTHERSDYGHGIRRTSTDTDGWDERDEYLSRSERERGRDRNYRPSKNYDGKYDDERSDSRPHRYQREETPAQKVVHELQDVAENIIPTVNDVLGNATGMSGYILTTTKEVIGNLFRIFKTPLTYIVVLYVFFILASFLLNKATIAVYKGLQPLCKPPLSSWVEMSFCETVMNGSPTGGGGIDPEKLMNVQSKLGLVVADFGEGVGMARGMKGTEHAVRDLIAVVRNSDMPRKEDVGGLLENFVTGAKKTSRELSRFSAKIAGTVDSVVSIDEYALHTLKRLRGDPDAQGSLMAYLAPALNPFQALNAHTTEAKIQAALTQITTHMSTKIPSLIIDAENLLSDLDALEHSLTLIGEVVHRERASIQESEQELLSSLWSRLWHSNLLSPALRESFRHHKDILASVTQYRERALSLVSKTLVELVAIQTDLELFRERLVAPALGETVPLEVQIDSIKRSVDRLNRGRRRMEGRRNVGLVEGRRDGEGGKPVERGTRGDNDEEDF